jgi:NDP-sugar pyrophosphorylase family protein
MNNRLPIQIVIPAAGLGSRFRITGEDTPKPLIKVFGIPMVLWVVANFNLTSNDKVILICRKEDSIEELLTESYPKFAEKLTFVTIDELTDGPATTVMMAFKEFNLELPLIVANSDQYVNGDLDQFLEMTTSEEVAGAILTMQASGTKWSYLTKDKLTNFVDLVVEKKEISDEATVGIYGWRKAEYFVDSYYEMSKADDRVNGELYVAPSYNYLIAKKEKICAINIGNVESEVFGMGTPEDLSIFLEKSEMRARSEQIADSLFIQ